MVRKQNSACHRSASSLFLMTVVPMGMFVKSEVTSTLTRVSLSCSLNAFSFSITIKQFDSDTSTTDNITSDKKDHRWEAHY